MTRAYRQALACSLSPFGHPRRLRRGDPVYGERERAVHLAATESHNCMYQ